MAEAALIGRDLTSGWDVISHLDAAGFAVFAALWLLRPDSSEWTFYIGSEEVDGLGRHEAYARLQKILFEANSPVPLRSFSLVGSSDQFLSSITGAITVEATSEIRVQNSVINGVFIVDAVIYRLRRPGTPVQISDAAVAAGHAGTARRPKAKPTKRAAASSPNRPKT